MAALGKEDVQLLIKYFPKDLGKETGVSEIQFQETGSWKRNWKETWKRNWSLKVS